MTPLERLHLPIIAAPMAGGPSTVTLVRDVTNAGGWGILAGANKSVDEMAREIEELGRFCPDVAINLFVPDSPSADLGAINAVAQRLRPVADELGTALGEPSWDDDLLEAKLNWLVIHPVSAVTFTFGLPEPEAVAQLKAAGTAIGVTVTSYNDALAAADRGADFLTVQGPLAGGHQSLFDLHDAPNTTPLSELLSAIRGDVGVPLIASGGLATPDDVDAALAAGAVAAQVGTAFLRSSSAGTSATHRAALASPEFTRTTLTRAFSGRYARGLHNTFAEEFTADAPAAYPEINRMTGPLRKAAAATGDAQWTHLWAGAGWERTREAMPAELIDGPAGPIAEWLAGAELLPHKQ